MAEKNNLNGNQKPKSFESKSAGQIKDKPVVDKTQVQPPPPTKPKN